MGGAGGNCEFSEGFLRMDERIGFARGRVTTTKVKNRTLESTRMRRLAGLGLCCISSWKDLLAGLFAAFVVASENRAIDVRPEFFEDVEKAVEADLGEPFLSGLGPGAFGSRVKKIGDPRSCPVADNFREIEGAASRIGSGNQKTADGIAGALDNPAASERVVSRVLMGHGRDDGFGQIVSDRLIGERVPIVAAIPRGPLTE